MISGFDTLLTSVRSYSTTINFKVSGGQIWIYDFGFTILDLRFWIYDFGFTILDLRFWIYDFGFTISPLEKTQILPSNSGRADQSSRTASASWAWVAACGP